MKLTIILTVYNKETYLPKALGALLNQNDTLSSDYEVLAVNDGSTDGSAGVLLEYASRDSRLRVFSQQNQGLSMARNNGVREAKGEYVWFVDADDVISRLAVKLICRSIVYKPDVIPIYAKTDGNNIVRNDINPSSRTGKDILQSGHWAQCGVFWVFRRDFLRDYGLRFMPGVYHEDAEFTPRMLYFAKTVKVIPEVLYTVYRDPESITQVPRPKRAFDYLIVSESLSKFVVDNNEEGTSIGKAIDSYTALDINNALFIICQNNKQECQLFNNAFFERRESLLRALKAAPQLKYRIECFLFALFPKHYVGIYKIMKFFSR